jgi:predicted aldo/keto reductase-like oxidoreductase
VARRLQREGRVRFVGFATHAPCHVIEQAIRTGEFDYVNLHWYFVNDLNGPAVTAAREHDMGVFIISPSDKGGKLYEPPAKMIDLCRPLSPMQFNDLYCLRRPEVHTLSIGAARPADFDEHVRLWSTTTGLVTWSALSRRGCGPRWSDAGRGLGARLVARPARTRPGARRDQRDRNPAPVDLRQIA